MSLGHRATVRCWSRQRRLPPLQPDHRAHRDPLGPRELPTEISQCGQHCCRTGAELSAIYIKAIARRCSLHCTSATRRTKRHSTHWAEWQSKPVTSGTCSASAFTATTTSRAVGRGGRESQVLWRPKHKLLARFSCI
jgi:hypothetical protein